MGLWSDTSPAGRGPAAPRKGTAHVDALERLEQWTRERFSLGDRDVVMVTETSSSLPGFPPRETQVGFWIADGTAHHFRVFKPATEVTQDDLPPTWMRSALAGDGFDCECC
jgi:hypothetical protein